MTTPSRTGMLMRHSSAATGRVVSLFVSASMIAFTSSARADEVSAPGTGIVGGAFLGAEVVTITESLIGIHPWLAYAIGGALGAGGGAVGGYYVEQASSEPVAPVAMLAGGLALVIPALVLSLNATRYRASDDASEDNAPPNKSALLNIQNGALTLGVPLPGIHPVYTSQILNQYGIAQQTELRMPAVAITF